jgi:3-phenylpropionate/trans-cinnamate dioxygenase alpha subunit
VGVPLESDGYKNNIDKAKHAAKSVAQISSFHGFVFATFDPEAPPLEE